MRDQTGKSLNSLLYEWNKATREIQLAELKDPNAYSKLTDELLAKPNSDTGISRRDLSPLIADKFRKNVLGDDINDTDSTEMESDQVDQFEQSINDDMNNDSGDEMSFDDMFAAGDDTFDAMFGGDTSDTNDDSIDELDSDSSTETPPTDEFSFNDLFDDDTIDENEGDVTESPEDDFDSIFK
jgi:hypothetical protein